MKMLKDYADYEFRGFLKYWRTKYTRLSQIMLFLISLNYLKIDFCTVRY